MKTENLDAIIARASELRDRLKSNQASLIKLSMINNPISVRIYDRIAGESELTNVPILEPYDEPRSEFIEDIQRQIKEFIENENINILTEIKSL